MTDEPTMTLDQAMKLLDIQKAQVETARAAFFKLAQLRGSELVIHQGHTLEQAMQYRNAELQGLDAQLAALVPEAEQPLELTKVVEEAQPPAELSPEDGA